MSTLDIDTVQAFLLVAELQSFTRAAEALGTTQAAVSMKLQRLEAVVGKRLVERSPRAVGLTADGSAFLPHARALIEAHDRALSGEAAGAAAIVARDQRPCRQDRNWCRCSNGCMRCRRNWRSP